MSRRAGIAIALGLVLFAAGTAWIATRPNPDARTIVSRVGGFAIEVPRGWTAETRRPRNEDRNFYVRSRRPGLLGLGSTEGFSVSRYEASDFASLRRDVKRYTPATGAIEEAEVAGYHAVIATARCRDNGFINGVLRHKNHCRTVSFIAGRFAYVIVTWSWTGAPDTSIAATFRALAPAPWTTKVPGTDARLTLPGGWTQRGAKGGARGPTFVAFSPGDPIDAWAYVFHYADGSVAQEVDRAVASITKNGGHNIVRSIGTIGGRARPRLDFDFPDNGGPDTHDVEWFLPDGHGGTLVFAVGNRAGDPNIAERLAATWHVR